MNRRPLRFVALAYAAVVLWLTVGPAPWRTSGNQVEGGILNPDAWTAPVTWTTGYLSEMAFNVALFIPVGAARRAAHPAAQVAARARRRLRLHRPSSSSCRFPSPTASPTRATS